MPGRSHLIIVIVVALLGSVLSGCPATPEKLVEDLGDPQTLVQEKARVALKEMGADAIPYLMVGLEIEASRVNAKNLLIGVGDAAFYPSVTKIEEVCGAAEVDEAIIDSLVDVVENTATPAEVLDTYIDFTNDSRCAETKMLELLKRLEPVKDDVTVDPGENLRYVPVRLAYQANPDLPNSRALARICLYDKQLGTKVSIKNRDKDESVYWAQWRMHDPLIRANLCLYLDEDIWGAYHDNFVPEILGEELKANEEDPIAQMGQFASNWRKRADKKAIAPLPLAHQGLKEYFANNEHYADEPCLVYTALEGMAVPVRAALEDNKRKKEIEQLDADLALLKVDKDAACQ